MCLNTLTQPRFSPPARWELLDFITVVLLFLLLLLLLLLLLVVLLLLLHHLCTSTSALPTLRQSLRQLLWQLALLDLNCRLPIWVGTPGPQPQGFERSGHRWTSARDFPSPVGTAGPQPGTFRAQWAPLDLNLGPFELSGHRWTSTAR